jgi:hypothetical protein
VSERPSASELLKTPDAVLNRSHLRELGWQRGAIDLDLPPLPRRHGAGVQPAAHLREGLPLAHRERNLRRPPWRPGAAMSVAVGDNPEVALR